MAIERLNEFMAARPFHPFAIHIADGRQLEVRSPEFISFSPSGHLGSAKKTV